MASKKRKYRETISTAAGNAPIDFDRIFRDLPPPQELVHAGEETRGLAGEGDARVDLPAEGDAKEPPATEPRTA